MSIYLTEVIWTQAREGNYIDKKCPFTGNVSIRGRILSGIVTKLKMNRTIVIRRQVHLFSLNFFKSSNFNIISYPQELSALREEIQPIWEETQECIGPLVPMLQGRSARRRGYRRRVQAIVQDSEIQHSENH